MEGRGTPDQSQAGPGDPPRDTTLRTVVHTQLADGEQGTPYNTYSPYRAWVDLEAGAAAAPSGLVVYGYSSRNFLEFSPNFI